MPDALKPAGESVMMTEARPCAAQASQPYFIVKNVPPRLTPSTRRYSSVSKPSAMVRGDFPEIHAQRTIIARRPIVLRHFSTDSLQASALETSAVFHTALFSPYSLLILSASSFNCCARRAIKNHQCTSTQKIDDFTAPDL